VDWLAEKNLISSSHSERRPDCVNLQSIFRWTGSLTWSSSNMEAKEVSDEAWTSAREHHALTSTIGYYGPGRESWRCWQNSLARHPRPQWLYSLAPLRCVFQNGAPEAGKYTSDRHEISKSHLLDHSWSITRFLCIYSHDEDDIEYGANETRLA
jgi:hypothetical protein